jgi:Transglycosylase-like domain
MATLTQPISLTGGNTQFGNPNNPAPVQPATPVAPVAPVSQTGTGNLAGMDMGAVNLAKAIRQTESGGDFNAKGASGESGAYQWTPATWQSHASQILGNANAPMTPANQNAVAYGVIKSWKDAGLNAAQIAAKWNSGSADGWENKIGVNSKGVPYNVPQYVKSVTDAYQAIKAGGSVGADPNNPSSTAAPSGGFIDNVLNSAGNVIGGIANAVLHPIKTVEGIANTVIGAGEGASNTILGTHFDNTQTQTFNAVKDYFGKRYGGGSLDEIVHNIGHTFYTDPVGAALDLSTFLDGVGGAVGVVGKIADVSKAAELAKASDFISTASGILKSSDPAAIKALTTPGELTKIANAVKIAGKYTNPLAPVTKLGDLIGVGQTKTGTSLAKSALGLSTDESANFAINNIKIRSANKMLAQATDIGKNYWQQIQGLLGNKIDEVVTPHDITNTLHTMTMEDGSLRFPNAVFKPEEIQTDVEKVLGSINAKLAEKFNNGTLTLADANQVAARLGEKAYRVGVDVHTIKLGSQEISAVRDAFRNIIKEKVPETKPLFNQYQAAINVRKGLAKIAASKGGSHLVKPSDIAALGLGAMHGGAPSAIAAEIGKKVLSSTPSKLLGAKVLTKTAKITQKTSKIVGKYGKYAAEAGIISNQGSPKPQ